MFQAAFWLSAITGAFAVAIVLIRRSFQESYDFPIISTLDSISVVDVPFPAVTIDAGEVQNPWGLIEKLFSHVDYNCYESPYDCPPDKEAPLEDLRPFTKKLVPRFFDIVFNNYMEMNITELQAWHRRYITFAKYRTFPDFDKAVALLAHVIDKKSSRSMAVRTKLATVTAMTFAKFSVRFFDNAINWGSRHFYPVVDWEAKWYNVSEEDIQPCLRSRNKSSSCPGTFKEAYLTLLLPFTFNRAPYTDLSLGEYMSYFASRVLTTTNKKFDAIVPFLNGLPGHFGSAEKHMIKLILNVTRQLVQDEFGIEINVNALEFVRLFGSPKYIQGKDSQAHVAGDDHGCHYSNFTRQWWTAWQIYQRVYRDRIKLDGVEIHQPPCSNDTIDSMLGITTCCSMVNPYKKHPALVLMMAKYSIQDPHFTQTEQEREYEHKLAAHALPKYRLRVRSSDDADLLNDNPRIFTCQYISEPPSYLEGTRCLLFARSYTNAGYGYGFNGKRFWDKHQAGNPFNHVFKNTMFPEVPLEVSGKGKDEILYPNSTGAYFGLFVAVQLNKYDRYELNLHKKKEKSFPTMKVVIHDPAKPADMRGSGVRVQPGYLTTFLITPSQLKSSPDIAGIDLKRRRCKFESESEGLEIFSNYTQKACQFECVLREAQRFCQCIPWNYPRFSSATDICDYMGVECFENVRIK